MNSIFMHQIGVELMQGDITKIEADVIVNAANSSLLGGGGVDGAIHRAGGKSILQDCLKIRGKQGGCPPGKAVITTAGSLPASYVIHTVGPVWSGGSQQEPELLQSCYLNSLQLAEKHRAASIAFPNISTGVYRFPKSYAAEQAIAATKAFIASLDYVTNSLRKIIFVCYDEENYEIYWELLFKEGALR